MNLVSDPGNEEPEPAAVPAVQPTEVATTGDAAESPASLWVELPNVGDPGRQGEIVPGLSEIGTGVPDTVTDFASVESFEIRAASTRGWSHRHGGVPRQDSYAVATTGDWAIVAVADGVSQGRFSHLAAEVAARSSARLLAHHLGDRTPDDATASFDWSAIAAEVSVQIVREALHRRFFRLPASDEPLDPSDPGLATAIRRHMATTLVVGFVSTTPTADGWPACVVSVAGDSAAYVVDATGFRRAGGGKEVGGVVTDTSVRPLPGAAHPVEAWLTLAPDQALLLVTDGIGDPFDDGSSEVATALHPLWRRPPRPAELIEQINFQRRTYDDDRTMVGVWMPERIRA